MPPTYHRYEEVLIAPPDVTMELLDAFASVGLVVTQPPKEVYNLPCMVQCRRLLTPELTHAAILVRLTDLCAATSLADKPLIYAEPELVRSSQQKQAMPFVMLSPLHRQSREHYWHSTC